MGASEIFFLRCKEEVNVDTLGKDVGIKILNAHYIASREHLEFALEHVEKAFERGENISKDPNVELMVRCSGQRQIKTALALFGTRSNEVAFIGRSIPPELKRYECSEYQPEMTEERYERIKATFGIDEKELAAVAGEDFGERAKALVEIIKERIALLPIA